MERLDVPVRLSSTVALHQRHYLIHGRPPVRDLLQALVDQPLQALVLVAVNIAPKGPLAYPEQPGRLLLSQAACLPPLDASSNPIFRISCSKFVRLIGHLLGVQ